MTKTIRQDTNFEAVLQKDGVDLVNFDDLGPLEAAAALAADRAAALRDAALGYSIVSGCAYSPSATTGKFDVTAGKAVFAGTSEASVSAESAIVGGDPSNDSISELADSTHPRWVKIEIGSDGETYFKKGTAAVSPEIPETTVGRVLADRIWVPAGATEVDTDVNNPNGKAKLIGEGVIKPLFYDYGSFVPALPRTGQLFLHTPTGRKVLLQYDGITWRSVMGYGTTTVYVDKTDGTDAIDKGYGVDSAAYKTIQYAIDQLPPVFTGNVVINVNGESYSETVIIDGKKGLSGSTLTVQGTTTTLDSGLLVDAVGTNSFAGAWTAPTYQYPTVARTTGTWTSNQRQNKWIRMTSGGSNGETRLIDSNTTTYLRPMGRFLGGLATNDTFDVFEPTTTVNKFVFGNGQAGVIIADINWSLGSGALTIDDCFGFNCEVTVRRCSVPSTGASSWWVQNAAKVVFDTCLITRFRMFIRSHSFVKFVGSKIDVSTSSAGNSCVQADMYSAVLFSDGCVLEGADTSNSEGLIITSTAFGNFNGDYRQIFTSTFPTTVRNCSVGVSVAGNGAVNSVYPQYVLYGDIRGSNSTSDKDSSSTNTSVSAGKLIDATANFTGLGVAAGDKVMWITTSRTAVWATVDSVDSPTELTLSADIFTASGRRYHILKDSSKNVTDDVAATGGIFL